MHDCGPLVSRHNLGGERQLLHCIHFPLLNEGGQIPLLSHPLQALPHDPSPVHCVRQSRDARAFHHARQDVRRATAPLNFSPSARVEARLFSTRYSATGGRG